MDPRSPDDGVEALLAEQVAYYRARAEEYDDTAPFGEYECYPALLAALEQFNPTGRVLELACGTGQWTTELVRYASHLTALDASPEMLALNQAAVRRQSVSYVQADVFEWRPPERYDVVFFAAWLSHVPPQRFEAFWTTVGRCLTDAGRVFLIDELPAVAALEEIAEGTVAPAVKRPLRSGASYRAIKVWHEPAELADQLRGLGWQADFRTAGWRFFYGTAVRA